MLYIVTPMYNVEGSIAMTVNSMYHQTDMDFKWIIVNDASTDESETILKRILDGTIDCDLITNPTNGCSLMSIIVGINHYDLDDEDIVCILDGDDWITPKCVETIKATYDKTGCWMTHGSYHSHPYYTTGEFSNQYPDSVKRDGTFRSHMWLASHMRTFKAGLWKRINMGDLMDSTGNIYSMTGDLAMTFPMLEMARERVEFINKKIYVYNMENPLNDHKLDHQRQLKFEREIRSKIPYERLESL
jgi:glycosyltransferase involved in cell wall biosynthesis